MRSVFTVFWILAIAGGAAADDRVSLAKRYESSENLKTLVEATMAFSTDISRACRMVRHVVPELQANYGSDGTLDDAYVSITSCCSVIDQANVLGLGNALAQIASPTRSELVNFVYSKTSAPVHAAIDSQLGDARTAVGGHCKKVPALATILSGGTK
ncbi:hypothetical protein DWF00_20180 [Bosea caraganae]|uniref:Secreted protein n=1 Tax=Bosea caraganae TaxID=2763117 RepID=A0A370KZ93_9HYPH|nr:hypothetical protein [Bosea caraganae]RDJ20313.1 hypothetical protein DWE98_25470 [Bosea caraganae]RDJ24009.1 hypothetical protein DWF00_20180 [Bosea caraganae]